MTADTVVLAGGRPGFIEDIEPGTEVAVLPVAGTTRMIGTTNLTVQASYFLDFSSYARWRLPEPERPGEVADRVEDPFAAT